MSSTCKCFQTKPTGALSFSSTFFPQSDLKAVRAKEPLAFRKHQLVIQPNACTQSWNNLKLFSAQPGLSGATFLDFFPHQASLSERQMKNPWACFLT